jgi:polar amino acid transport system substrate-binding protein
MVLSRKILLLCLLAFAVTALFAACGDDDDDDAQPSATATAAATPTASGAPIDFFAAPELSDGKLTVGSDIAYAPNEFYVEGTQDATGMDVDLINALGEAMGVTVEFQQVAEFSGIVGDLQAKRYDIVVSSISITPEREAVIDLIPYFGPVGTGILTPTGNPNNFETLEDLCGFKVSAQVGTYQVDQVTALNEGACASNPITLTTFPDNPASVQELLVGRVDAQLADDPVVKYSEQLAEGELEVAATGFEAATYGIGVRKDSPELKAALKAALQQIIDDGTYDAILEKWNQTQFALES